MSLPNYLAKIKSAGMYRFTFDKSQVPAATAETMRLVVGYSDKGPFNNPVYIDNKQDFINLFGNVNKRLEKKGVFFHRLALQALSAGPILALNLKPFDNTNDNEGGSEGTIEQVGYVSFNPCDVANNIALNDETSLGQFGLMDVRTLFDRNRFWKIDNEQLPSKIKALEPSNSYINIAATDVKDMSCSLFVRKCNDASVKEYNLTVRDWYNGTNEEMPEYLEGHENSLVKDYFAEVYVFRGQFTDALIGGDGTLKDYFTADALTTECKNVFKEPVDALEALAGDPNSNFVGLYRGCLLPYFKDQLGNYVSLDILFNADKDNHKMIMKLDDSIIDDVLLNDAEGHNKLTHWLTSWNASTGVNTALKPTYIQGYEYNSIKRADLGPVILTKVMDVLSTEKGIYDALTNHVDSEYHYIIDTFATPATADGTSAKVKFASIAKAKDNCLAIINAPAMVDLQKIAGFTMSGLERGDYKGTYVIPSEANGASYCAYYTPLVFADGLVKTTVPSAALVSNNFMEKWNSRQPYYIVAGPNYGRMDAEGMIGPDYNYSRADLDVFEPMGINCMVYVPRKGTYINSNQTAKQTPVSALSKVHVRELVIYLQNEIENMMQNFQWELNTQTLRDTIKAKADAILTKVKNNGGVYEFLNVCDGSNNTPEVIDNEMIILDTSIEPARGAGKMVQRLTIHKTGGISALTK
jgi:hypothetical protein